uniref:PEP-utilising enzyme mobile domain-containing protein n=1 Tax=Biomphalaria glabrata TaxID=6526 RepID=A0A2C9LI54_BIOGL
MVYGNINDESGTGVLFSRNPSNGDKELFGDYLINAQGEDVVSGTRNTNSICANGDQSKKEGIITQKELISRIPIKNLNEIIYPTLDPIAQKNIICNGLAASPGAACGVVVFNTESMKAKDIPYILVRTETNPEDIEGMNIANGILTARGGITSHAAVVARGMGKPCVCGASAISINYNKKIFTTENGHTIKEGDYITIDGGTGE